MKIESSAIRLYKLENGCRKQTVLTGFSHSNILEYISFTDMEVDRNSYEYGFVTDTGDFVNREIAMNIAKKAGQISNYYSNKNFLESYMLKK